MAGTSFSAASVSRFFEFRFYRSKAAAIKCNVTSWDDQLSLFEFAFEKYGAVDIVVCILLPAVSPHACCTNERQIPNAGITENARGQCLGDLKVVDGKPVAPKLATLEVNLIAVFYSQ
jgi:NAD(P)-dependent dehydrogenase (short-subunit alcohol dehydrogenase family)